MELANQASPKKAKAATVLLLASVVFLSALGPVLASGATANPTPNMASGSDIAYPA